MSKARPVLWAAAAALLVAALGAAATDLGPWYQSLAQPAWKPPDWLFAPAWTLIYALAATAAVLAWRAAPSWGARSLLVFLFGINALLNILWSALFFTLHRPDLAAYEVVVLWLSIVILILVPGRWHRTARWLLVPYLAWVTVAAALNFAVVRLNPPFA